MERGPHGERCPYPETFLAYLPGSTVKELPPSPPPRSLCRERCPIPRAASSSSQSPRWTSPPPGSPDGAPMERDARLQSLFYISFRVPRKGALPPGSLHRAPTERETAHLLSPFRPYLKVPGRRALLQLPQTGPLWKEMPISRALSTYSSGSQAGRPSL